MKSILTAFFLMLFSVSSYSKTDETTGFGLIIGSPTGVNLKHFTTRGKTAIESDFAIEYNRIYLTASYLWHDYEALSPVEEGKLPIFYGPTVAVFGDNPAIGGTFGVAYVFDEHPFDVVIKLSSIIIFNEYTTGTFIGGIGARYFFR